MITSVFSIFALAILAPWLVRSLPKAAGKLFALLPAAICVFFAARLPSLSGGEAIAEKYAWATDLSIDLAFRGDGLSVLFALLVTGIGALVVLYADGYLAGHRDLGRFYALTLFFMGSMLGLVLSDNLYALFIFWELTSISSYLLIGFNHEDEASRKSALQALLVTGLGGLALLAGFILLHQMAGSPSVTDILQQADAVKTHGLYTAALVLVLIGAFTKSAQVPFHFWLPNAMAAPTPVSAYLHSATMVKAGVFLLARLHPVLGGTSSWTISVTLIGAVTMVFAAAVAFFQSDLKRILAYSTVCVLGMLTMLLGIGTDTALKAMTVLLVAHSFYKGALFMVAGSIDHETGTRDIEQLGGLRGLMPLTCAAAVCAGLSKAGLPPLLGFIGKETLYEAVLASGAAAVALTVASVATGMLLTGLAGLVVIRTFFGQAAATPKTPHEAPWTMLAGPVVLSVAGLLFALLPSLLSEPLIGPAVSAIHGETIPVKLSLWHGFNAALALSVTTALAGAALYLFNRPVRKLALPKNLQPPRMDSIYESAINFMTWSASCVTNLIQNGCLRNYLVTILATLVLLLGVGFIHSGALAVPLEWQAVTIHETGVALLVLLSALAVVRSRSRLGAVISLGAVGFGVALIYLLFGAPDLALTQLLVETLSVLLFVFAFYRLPEFINRSSRAARLRDASIAIAAGAMMAALTLLATHVQLHPTISNFHSENSQPLAHGRNIVNVILVDFRALDTLGEITVLAVAAVGVAALLRLRPKEKES